MVVSTAVVVAAVVGDAALLAVVGEEVVEVMQIFPIWVNLTSPLSYLDLDTPLYVVPPRPFWELSVVALLVPPVVVVVEEEEWI